MKNLHLPKISLLVQIGDEIQAMSCSKDSIKNTSKKAWIVNVTIQANFTRIRMESSEQTGAYSITTHQFALACVAVSEVVRK